MLSRIGISILLSCCCLQLSGAFNPISLTETSANPVETMFGNGYICLHITDPIFESSPSFQALAVELAKRFNKTVVKVGSNETDFPHTEAPDTEHFEVTTTTVRPIGQSLIRKAKKLLKCEKEGFFSNPNNCTKFYRCVQQKVKSKPWKIVEFDCPEYLIFDPKTKVCANAWDVDPLPDCVLSEEQILGLRGQGTTTTTTEAPDEEEQEVMPGGQDQITEPPPLGPGGRDEPTDEGEIETKPDEKCAMPGLYPDEGNCHQYFQCFTPGGDMVMRTCPDKMIFVPDEEECRHPKDVSPKPPCYHRRQHIKTVVQVNETTEITEDYEKPDQEGEEETTTTEEPEFFDEFDSTAMTQVVVKPGKHHVIVKNKTVTETTEEIEEGETEPSHVIPGKKKRITIPRPIGPKPIPQCVMDGIHPHPTECNMYMKCVKRGPNLKTFFFPCTPNGTIYHPESGKCVEPRSIQPMPPYPDCVPWDDVVRPQIEEILNEDAEEEETTTTPRTPGVVPPVEEGETPGPDDTFEETETKTPDGVTHITRKNVTTTIEETEIDIPGEVVPGKHTTTTPAPAVIDGPAPPPPDYEEEDLKTTTGAPSPLKKTTPAPIPCQDVDKACEVCKPCGPCEGGSDDELVKKLTQERDEARERITILEKQNTRLEAQVKKVQKELGAAKKEKQKYENYIASMDKTIDDYKEEVAWYRQHCPQPTEFVDDDDDTPKARKRRSLDTSVTPVVSEQPGRVHDRFDEDFHEVDSVDTKRSKVKKFRQFNPRPIHDTAEIGRNGRGFGRAPFPSYDESIEEISTEIVDEKFEGGQRHHGKGHHQGHGHRDRSMWSADPEEGSFFMAQIPFLIVTVLAVLLITITLLGCLVVRRLNRMTTFSVSALDEFESQSPATYRRRNGVRKFGSTEKLRHV